MPKYLNQWNNLDTCGKKGQGMKPVRDYAHSIAINLHYYASILGLMVSIAPYVLNFLGMMWMKVYLVYEPYSDRIDGIYSDGKQAYKKALELNESKDCGDIKYKVLETDTEHKEELKEVV